MDSAEFDDNLSLKYGGKPFGSCEPFWVGKLTLRHMAAPPGVADALQRAADRAKRLAELDHAQGMIERELKFPHPPENLPWGDVLSKTYLLTKSPESLHAACCTINGSIMYWQYTDTICPSAQVSMCVWSCICISWILI